MSRLIQLTVLVGLMIMHNQALTAQQKEPPKPRFIPQTASQFDVKDEGVVEALVGVRQAAILRCTHELRQENPMAQDANKAALRAAWLLGELRVDDQQAIEALLDNLTLSERFAIEEHPLAFLPAAKALARIGNITYRDVEKFLQHQRSQRELRILAFVIIEIDGIELARDRLNLELRKLDAPSAARNANAEKIKNWRQINDWLSTPGFRESRENWP